MHECETMTGVSTQEEEDTLMIQVASNGMNVHIYPQDTDVLLLALRRTPLPGDRSVPNVDYKPGTHFFVLISEFCRCIGAKNLPKNVSNLEIPT